MDLHTCKDIHTSIPEEETQAELRSLGEKEEEDDDSKSVCSHLSYENLRELFQSN